MTKAPRTVLRCPWRSDPGLKSFRFEKVLWMSCSIWSMASCFPMAILVAVLSLLT